MGDWEIECIECGWRGMMADADQAEDKPGTESVKTCPDCGGQDFLSCAGGNETENS